MITSFSGEFEFLSNFFPVEIEWEGIVFPTTEHAFQAGKTLNSFVRVTISKQATPGRAKRLGRQIKLRPDWEEVKIPIMEEILRIKFSIPQLKVLLQSTRPQELVEGNNWGDTFWGVDVSTGHGRNELGILLMKIREEG